MAIKKILIKKEKKQFVEDLNREVIINKGKRYYISNLDKDFQTKFDKIPKQELQKENAIIKSKKDKEFHLIEPKFIDHYLKIKRSMQIIPLKDVGFIISYCGINKNSTIMDAGSGSGALSLFLAAIAKKVNTYDIVEKNIDLVNQNIQNLNLKNINCELKDVYNDEQFNSKCDIFTLDVPEPWKAIKTIKKCLKTSGFLVVYNPCIPQIQDFVTEIKKEKNFIVEKIVEIIQREWEVNGRKVRPKTKAIGHSGFLCFVRKI